MTVIKTINLTVEIGSTTACQGLSVAFQPGQICSMLGRNGVGKSTLLQTLAGLRPPKDGKILLEDTPLQEISRRKRAQQIGILFQEHDPTFPATVLETALTGRHPWLSPFQGEGENDIRMASAVLQRMGIGGMEDRELPSLSGGERRRVDLAALVLQQTRVVLLDEPVNHLDLRYQVELLGELVRKWRKDDDIVIMVMHDVNLALRFSDHLLLLFGNGESLYGSTEKLATENTLSRLYGHRLRRYPANGKHFFLPA